MEALEAVSGGEWNSFNGMFSEDTDFMAQLFGNCSLPENPNFGLSSYFWPDHDPNVSMVVADGNAASDETTSNNFCYSGGSSISLHSSNNERNWPSISHIFIDSNLITDKNNINQVPLHNNGMMDGGDFLTLDSRNFESSKKLPDEVHGKNFQLQNGYETPIPEPMKEDESATPLEILKKRPRIPRDFERSKKRVKTNKDAKVNDNADNNTNVALHRQSSSSYCSEDELNGMTTSSSSKGTTRASRGSATDPQSLYARKRRERINERLRILQNLVPNGTKVDISTMLEVAVQYVKFLQLQIKLLSSDDMWMYAPIAYNGMDLGLNVTISKPESQ